MNTLTELHEQQYKRAIFYFPKNDEAAVEAFLEVPDRRKPGGVRDLHFKFCGHKLKRSADFDKFVDETVPAKFKERFAKSEKGIDIEMCCDGLKLASAARLERLFLFTNDGDFIPFCRTVKEFGANISIIHLNEIVPPNGDLLHEVDSYDVIPLEQLRNIFLPLLDDAAAGQPEAPQAVDAQAVEEMLSEKPEAEPSDLKIAEETPEQGDT
jgi:hypothetical protein